jgi:two-component system chemotaxis response regulator CheY
MALNVLVVDDSAVMRAMITRILALSGIPLGEVTEAGNGEEALAMLDGHWVDLALVDINMPVMNGLELIAQVRRRADAANLKIIVVSTESSQTRISELRQMGVAFIHKPFTPEQLKAKIVQATGVSDVPAHCGSDVQHGGPDF